jgi:hypothetical protein
MQRSSPPGSTPSADKWFRQPVLWLAALISLAILIGCIATIIVASRNADAPVETPGPKIMKVPVGPQGSR